MNNAPFEINEKLITKINDLIQLDMDASYAFGQAIDGIEPEHAGVRSQLQAFKADHERHILELSNVVAAQGQDPPEYRRDFKGFLIEGMTAARSALGTVQALKAMLQNETLLFNRYEAACDLTELPEPILAIILRGRDDERRHLDYVEQALAILQDRGAPSARA